MTTKILISPNGTETTVKLVRETPKAILVRGNCSEAWYPKAAIGENGQIADWFRGSLVHYFLFDAPYTEESS